MGKEAKYKPSPEAPSTTDRWLWTLIFLSLIGLGTSIYLSVLHWQVHHIPGHVSFCAISAKINCDEVALSPYSVFLGVPISTWGILFFSLMVALGIWGRVRNTQPFPWGFMAILNAGALCGTVLLFCISSYVIRSLCILCVVLYLTNLVSWFLTVAGQRRSGVPASSSLGLGLLGIVLGLSLFAVWFPKVAFSSISWICIGIGMVLSIIATAWWGGIRGFGIWWNHFLLNMEQLFVKPLYGLILILVMLLGVAVVFFTSPLLYSDAWKTTIEGLARGHTAEGHNWIGAENPQVVITEYSDYECPFCRNAHQVIREVVSERKEWLQLIHVHVPLDQSCNSMVKRPMHKNACACSRAAICADAQGRFWEMNDALYQRRCRIDVQGLISLASQLKLDLESFEDCIQAPSTERVLLNDIGQCRDLVSECREMGKQFGTPTFVMEEEVIIGPKTKEWWMKATDRARIKKTQP